MITLGSILMLLIYAGIVYLYFVKVTTGHAIDATIGMHGSGYVLYGFLNIAVIFPAIIIVALAIRTFTLRKSRSKQNVSKK